MIQNYQQLERYEASPETKCLVNAKFAALEVLSLMLRFEANATTAVRFNYLLYKLSDI